MNIPTPEGQNLNQMKNSYKVYCDCRAVELCITGQPIVHAYCHCVDCRELLNVPYHAVTAWNSKDVTIQNGSSKVVEYQHPELDMKRVFCADCGEVLFNTNIMGWRVVSQWLIAKCNGEKLPPELCSDKHFFYEQRVVDIDDELPKYLRGTDGPLY